MASTIYKIVPPDATTTQTFRLLGSEVFGIRGSFSSVRCFSSRVSSATRFVDAFNATTEDIYFRGFQVSSNLDNNFSVVSFQAWDGENVAEQGNNLNASWVSSGFIELAQGSHSIRFDLKEWLKVFGEEEPYSFSYQVPETTSAINSFIGAVNFSNSIDITFGYPLSTSSIITSSSPLQLTKSTGLKLISIPKFSNKVSSKSLGNKPLKKIQTISFFIGVATLRSSLLIKLNDSTQEVKNLFAGASINSTSPVRIKINKPNITPEIEWLASTELPLKLEAITLPDVYDVVVQSKNAITSGFAPTIEHIPFIETFELTPSLERASLSSKIVARVEAKLTTRLPTTSLSAIANSRIPDPNIEVALFQGGRLIPTYGSSKASTSTRTPLVLIKPPPASNRFILRPIDLTIAGPNVIALWQPRSGSLLPVPQDLWAGNQQLFLGFVRLGTSGVVQLRFRASQVAPSSGANDDISDEFENNGVIEFESGANSVRLDIGGLDTTEPYGYDITGTQLANLQAFLRSLPPTTNSLVMTLYARNPPNIISLPAARASISASQGGLGVDQIGTYILKNLFEPALVASEFNIVSSQISPDRGITRFTPQPSVGWAAVIEGIGLGRDYFRVWSGVGQLELEGDTYEGTTFDGGAFASVSAVENSVGSPSRRVNVAIAVPSAAVRSMLNIDVGPVWIRVFNIVSQDSGQTWAKLPTGIAGRLSRPSFDVEGSMYTMEIETYSGDADRGRPKIWSAESQMNEYPGDRGFDFTRDLEAGVEIRWPP